MSVCLGELKSDSSAADTAEVWAAQYDADSLSIQQGDADDEGIVYLDRKQLQELSKIIDRFLDQ